MAQSEGEEEEEEGASSEGEDASFSNSSADSGKRKLAKDEWKYRRRKKRKSSAISDDSDDEEPPQRRRSLRLSSDSSEENFQGGTRSWVKPKLSNAKNGNVSDDVKIVRSKKHMDEHVFHLLTDFYRANPYPSKQDFRKLEKLTEMSSKRLLYWFSNRRRRDGVAVKRPPKDASRDQASDVDGDQDVRDTSDQDVSDFSEKKDDSDVSAEAVEESEASDVDRVPLKRKKKGRPTGQVEHFNDNRQILLDFYKSNPYPNAAEVAALMEKSGLEKTKIRHFFSRRRGKDGITRENHVKTEASSDSSSSEDARESDDGDAEEEKPASVEVPNGAVGTLDTYACLLPNCDYSSHCRWNLTRHLRGQHDIDPWACRACQRFYRPEEATDHPCGPGLKRFNPKKTIETTKAVKATKTVKKLPKVLSPKASRKGDVSLKDLMSSLSRPPPGKKALEANGQKTKMVSYAENGLFIRNGRLEVIMVNGDQYDAVQRFMNGLNMVRERVG